MGYDTMVETTVRMSAVALLRAAQAIGQEGCRLRDEASVQHAETVMLRHKNSWSELQHRITADRLLAEGTEMVRAAYALSRVAQRVAGTSGTHAQTAAELDARPRSGPHHADAPSSHLMRMVQQMWEDLPQEPHDGLGGEHSTRPCEAPQAPADEEDPFT